MCSLSPFYLHPEIPVDLFANVSQIIKILSFFDTSRSFGNRDWYLASFIYPTESHINSEAKNEKWIMGVKALGKREKHYRFFFLSFLNPKFVCLSSALTAKFF